MNTIIPHLSKSNATSISELIKEYENNVDELEKKFKEMKILDPACGSGAFLVKAIDILLEIHKEIQDIKGKSEKHSEKQLQITHEWDENKEVRAIIENNIYGVDINPESIDITKLSLFLKLASNERKLIGLSNNIKVGNSLVDDNTIDSHGFLYDKEFPEVMELGKFDIIIGNPPYIRVQRIKHEIIDFLLEKYECAHKKFDISLMFFEKSLELINEDGLIGFISSSQWLNTDYGEKLREMLSKGLIKEIIDFGSLPIFEDASTYPAIFILSKDIQKRLQYKKIKDQSKLSLEGITSSKGIPMQYLKFGKKSWSFNEFDLISHLEKNKINWNLLSTHGNFYYGTISGQDEVFIVSIDIVQANNLEQKFLFPYAYQGREVKKFLKTIPSEMIIYPYKSDSDGKAILMKEDELKSKAPNIHNYLLKHKPKLLERKDSRKFYAKGENWFKLVRQGNFNLIYPKKLLIKGIEKESVVGFLSENTAFSGANSPAFILENEKYDWKVFLCILNSTIISQYLQSICPAKLHGFFRFNTNSLNTIPIPEYINKSEIQELEKTAQEIIDITSKFHLKQRKFFNRVLDNFGLEQIPQKINKIINIDFKIFLNTITKSTKKKLSLKEQEEWEEYFEDCRNKLIKFEESIRKDRLNIDEIVFRIYYISNIQKNIKK